MVIDSQKVMDKVYGIFSPFGGLQTLERNSETKLRILEYKDTNGSVIFAKRIALHLRCNHYLDLCRRETFSKDCLFCDVNQNCKKAPFTELIFKYAVNAIEVDLFPSRVFSLMIPSIVFDHLCDYVLEDKHEDIMAPDTGRIFIVSSRGKGIQTRYSVKLTEKVFPVGDDILSQVTEPTSEIWDPGLDEQKIILRNLKNSIKGG